MAIKGVMAWNDETQSFPLEPSWQYACACGAFAPIKPTKEEAYAAAMKRDGKKGEWIGFAEFEQCSVCKATHLKEIQTVYGKAIWVKSNFCPNCGAAMTEKALQILVERTNTYICEDCGAEMRKEEK